MSYDIILAISRLFFSRIYETAKFFIHLESSSVEGIECSKITLFCGDCCHSNQAIILVLVLVSL